MKSNFLISGIETGQLNAMVKNIMSQTGVNNPQEAVRMLNAGEMQISLVESVKKLREANGLIHLSVTSDGTTGEAWIYRLNKRRTRVSEYSKEILTSKEFQYTSGVVYEIAVVKGDIFTNKELVMKNIRNYAKNHRLFAPNMEVACLIREKLSDKDLKSMGLKWIIVMHKPMQGPDADIKQLGIFRGAYYPWLLADCSSPDEQMSRGGGFAFVVSHLKK